MCLFQEEYIRPFLALKAKGENVLLTGIVDATDICAEKVDGFYSILFGVFGCDSNHCGFFTVHGLIHGHLHSER